MSTAASNTAAPAAPIALRRPPPIRAPSQPPARPSLAAVACNPGCPPARSPSPQMLSSAEGDAPADAGCARPRRVPRPAPRPAPSKMMGSAKRPTPKADGEAPRARRGRRVRARPASASSAGRPGSRRAAGSTGRARGGSRRCRPGRRAGLRRAGRLLHRSLLVSCVVPQPSNLPNIRSYSVPISVGCASGLHSPPTPPSSWPQRLGASARVCEFVLSTPLSSCVREVVLAAGRPPGGVPGNDVMVRVEKPDGQIRAPPLQRARRGRSDATVLPVDHDRPRGPGRGLGARRASRATTSTSSGRGARSCSTPRPTGTCSWATSPVSAASTGWPSPSRPRPRRSSSSRSTTPRTR